MRKTISITTLLATALAGTALAWAAPVQADDGDDDRHDGPARRGTCAGATYKIDVDRERRGFDVDGSIDRARPGSQWRVTITHDGKVVTSRTVRTDDDGEADVEVWRGNSAGSDTFALTVQPAGGGSCTTRVSTR